MLTRGYIFLVFIFYQVIGLSQTVHFKHLTNADGLSQSEVYSFLEDSRGFMWFGTVDGLNQYDGYGITIFNTDKNNPNSISNSTIRSLAEDSIGRVWIGTDDGLCVFDPVSEKIFQVRIACIEDNALLQVKSIIVDKNHLLLGTSQGLLRANITSSNLEQIGKEFQWVNYSENHLMNIFDATLCKNGVVWVLTSSTLHGMVFQSETKNPFIIESIVDKNFVSNIALKEDKYGNLWIISHTDGFYRYNPTTKKLDHFTENLSNRTIISNNYSDAETDDKGNLWISSRDRGLLFLEAKKLNDGDPQFENICNVPFDDKSLNSNLVYSLYISKNNILWVGTIGSGINIYDPQQKEFNHIKIPLYNGQIQSSSNFIRSVYSDKENNIWLGTHNNGLYVLNRKNNTFRKAGFGNQSIFYICDLGSGNTLICSSEGVSLVEMANNEIRVLSSYISHAFFYACKSRNEIIWLASLNGVIKARILNGKLQIEKAYSRESKPSISFDNCRVLFYNNEENELLAGTEGGGLNILKFNDNQEVIAVDVYKKNDTSNSISNNYIRSIAKDSNGDLWIGTYEGLNKLLRKSASGGIEFKSYTNRDGLPNNMIQLLVEDNDKKLWIGTNGGLSRFDSKNEQFVNYAVNDGLQSNEFSEHTVFKKSDGEIIVGGINGINWFYPAQIRPNNRPPKTTITGFDLFNKRVEISDGKERITPLTKSIVLTDSIFFKPNENSFGFDFSAMLHSNPEKINYAFMLAGFEKDWNYTDGKSRRANYTNLKYGKYVFMVKSTDTDGKWEDSPRRIMIQIKTPFVYTWVAFIIYFLIIISLIVYFTNYSVIKYTTKKKLRLENEHNKKLHELDEVRTRFFINISHDLRTPLTLISSPLEMVLKHRDLKPEVISQLNLMQRNVKKLSYITEQLLDIRKAEAGKLSAKRQTLDIVSFIKKEATHFTYAVKSKGLEYYIISNEEAIYTGFDADMISKLIFNLLSNAIKYTHKGEINIRIERVSQDLPEILKKSKYPNFIRIDVQDSGEGIEKTEIEKIFDRFYQGIGKSEKGYGIGLSHCKELVEALGGELQVNSEKNVGTTFRLFIPDIRTEDIQQGQEFQKAPNEDVYIESMNDLPDDDILPDNVSLQKILVIEDNHDMRNFIKNELKKEFKVFEAEDGIKGKEMAEKFSPDLIISDIMMPNMDGIELCKKLKSDIKTSHIPVILLTAKVDTPTKYEGIEMGADDYISKPFEMEYLLLRIKNILKSRELLRRMFQLNNSLNPSVVTVSSLDEKFLNQLIKGIEEGISDPDFTVNSLESKMGMSHANFYRKIKNLTGQSCKDILLNMRMKRAKQILTDNKEVRISEVAYMIGYTNPKYFSQSFKEFYGVLPSDITK